MDFFKTFPSQWEWVALILGCVSLLMAVYPFILAIWGRPKLKVSFANAGEWVGVTTGLCCVIHNVPIDPKAGLGKRVLDILGVQRATAEHVHARLWIADVQTGNVVFNVIPKIDTHSGHQAQRLSLPASYYPNTFGVAMVDDTGRVIPGFNPGLGQTLDVGYYEASVRITVGVHHYPAKQRFVVQNKSPRIYWVNS